MATLDFPGASGYSLAFITSLSFRCTHPVLRSVLSLGPDLCVLKAAVLTVLLLNLKTPRDGTHLIDHLGQSVL